MEGLRKLYAGDFNDMNQERQPDGSVFITLSKRGEDKIYRFRVEGLYGENEQVLEHEVINVDIKPWIKQRMDEAKRQLESDAGGD